MTGYLILAETGALILSLFFVGVSFGGSSPLASSIVLDRVSERSGSIPRAA